MSIFDASYILKFIPKLLQALPVTIEITIVAAIAFVFLAFSLNEAAYNSEMIRSAILAVDKNEIEAGIAMGMTGLQVMRRITLPQALVVALPNLGNSFISLLKNTSLAFTVSVLDIMGAAKVASGRNLRFFEVYIAAALIYWIVCIIIEVLTKQLEKKIDVKRKNIKKGGLGSVRAE